MGLLVIIILLIVGIIAVPSITKEDTKINIPDKNINLGNSLVVILTDSNGNRISDADVDVKITDENGKVVNKTLTTDSKGKLKINLDDVGEFSVECKFNGNGKYKSSSVNEDIEVKAATTNSKSSSSSDSSSHTITVTSEFDKTVKKSSGEYSVEVTKWKGTTVGGFGVSLYKNGQLMDRNSYESRAYFHMDGEWKWSNWSHGEEDALYQKYPVSNDVEIREVEVRF